jgi:hypothetical protein
VLTTELPVFCFSRIISSAARIAWACQEQDRQLAIVQEAFQNAGLPFFYVVNLFLAQRIWRGRHPGIGWSLAFAVFILSLMLITIVAFVMMLVVESQSFLTRASSILKIDRDIELFVLTWYLFMAVTPLSLVLLALGLPRNAYIDKFGSGRFRWKYAILATASGILTLSAGWRCGTAVAYPLTQSALRPWYFSSACYYVFVPTLEIMVLLLYFVTRIDHRFYVPDGAAGPGEYSWTEEEDKGREWPDAVYLPVTEVRHDRWGNLRAPRTRQDFLQVDPRTGRYQLAQPNGSRHSQASSIESRRGRWSRTSWDRRSRRSLRSQQSQNRVYTSQTSLSQSIAEEPADTTSQPGQLSDTCLAFPSSRRSQTSLTPRSVYGSHVSPRSPPAEYSLQFSPDSRTPVLEATPRTSAENPPTAES